jgi:hypothetical protein
LRGGRHASQRQPSSRALQILRSESAFFEAGQKGSESVRYRLLHQIIIHGTQVMADPCLGSLIKLWATCVSLMSEPLRCCPGQPTVSCH